MTAALHDWCEPNWTVTLYIAEFWNTITNLIYIFVGLWTVFEFNSKIFNRMRISGMALFFIGIGSMCYHGTITRWGQAFDELAILYWEIALLATIFKENEMKYHWIKYCYLPFAILETVIYWQMDNYPAVGWPMYHVLHVAIDFIIVITLYFKFRELKNRYYVNETFEYNIKFRGLGCISFSFFAWLLDYFYCDIFKYWYLHAFGWHLFSGLAIFQLHLGIASLVCIQNKKKSLHLRYLKWNIELVHDK